MGEFTNDGDNNSITKDATQFGGEMKDAEGNVEGYATDVQDVTANDIVRQGTDEFPCFDVTSAEFHQNMQDGRRRLRWKNGSSAQKYMSGTKYNRAFYVRYTDDAGKKYVRKIK